MRIPSQISTVNAQCRKSGWQVGEQRGEVEEQRMMKGRREGGRKGEMRRRDWDGSREGRKK